MAASSLGEVVDRARRRSFVGRRSELGSFDAAVTGSSARRVLLVHGPGGIGKTTLLLEMAARARATGRAVTLVDGRDIDPSPEGFGHAVGALGVGGVLLVDGYEQLAPIDGWLRSAYLSRRPADDVVVLAGRDAPAPAWRVDPGWREVVAVHPLGHLDDADSADLLERAGVDGATRDRLLRLGRGHPLALALLADVAAAGTVPERLADVPDLLTELLESVLREAPSEAHMAGLATCATAWLTTEELLRRTVGPDAPAVWAWLRRRPFVVSRPGGLTPHDLTRDALDAEFERRSPERYRALHRVVHDHFMAGLRAAGDVDRPVLAQHLLFLHRRSPLHAMFSALRAQGSAAVLPARPDELGGLVSMLERERGPATAAIAEGWFADQPEHVSVVRTEDGIAGFAYHLFCPTGSSMEDRDPVVRAALDHVARTGPLRPGEQVNIARFMCGARDGERSPYAGLAAAVSSIMIWCIRPLAWTIIPTTDPGHWGPYFEYLGFRPVREVDSGGLRHVLYANDWRRFPTDVWMELMNEREHCGGSGPPPPSMLRPPPLARAAHATAVRSLLHDLHRPDRLAANPLAGTALGGDAAALRASLAAAVRHLAGEPRGEQLRAVLDRTFLRPAPTQEAAAEVLGLPFSTYRRHLAKAVEQLTELLWAVEIGTLRLASEVTAGPEVSSN